jgi:hypothetical protein
MVKANFPVMQIRPLPGRIPGASTSECAADIANGSRCKVCFLVDHVARFRLTRAFHQGDGLKQL